MMFKNFLLYSAVTIFSLPLATSCNNDDDDEVFTIDGTFTGNVEGEYLFIQNGDTSRLVIEPSAADVSIVDNGDGSYNILTPEFSIYNTDGTLNDVVGVATLRKVEITEQENGEYTFTYENGNIIAPWGGSPSNFSGSINGTISGKKIHFDFELHHAFRYNYYVSFDGKK